MKRKALVVLSGGQDSTTCLAWALAKGYEVSCLTFNYNQRHAIELEAAAAVAKLARMSGEAIPHEVVAIGPILAGTSPLTNPAQSLETYTDYQSMDKIIGDRVETTFVPMRNALFLTLAANRAVVGNFDLIITGVCQADNANYPDCRQRFIASQEQTIHEALGTSFSDGIHILTPLMDLSKAESIHMLKGLGRLAWLAFSHTAYDGTYPPVSKDHASTLRAQGFFEAGLPDPLVLRAAMGGLMELPITPNYDDRLLNTELMADIILLDDHLKGITNASA